MKIISSVNEFFQLRNECRKTKSSIGFVPTMGALHEGHVSLVKKAKEENDLAIVSIFVNPTQFNDPKDLTTYPRTWQEDVEKLSQIQTDILFAPDYKELYPDNYRYIVLEKEFSKVLCGSTRPGHFDGVLSVVMKLFNIVLPQKAYFGEKDYQQLLLIKGMVEAYFMNIEIVPCPIVREADGLAMSSRNKRLSLEGRKKAPLFYKIISESFSKEEAKLKLESVGFQVDYVEEMMKRRFAAIFLDNVRLIDNVECK